MPTLKRHYLEPIIESIRRKKLQLQWLVELNVPGQKIANFGCGIDETFALMWALGAIEATGIDKDILEAEKRRLSIQQDVKESLDALQYYEHIMTESDRLWWESEVPDSLKKGLFPDFTQGDITRPTGLPPDHFHLAYCRYVLYHIWGDQDELGSKNVRAVIKEMARVVRSGGWVVAVEPPYSTDDRPLDFTQFFEQARLNPAANIDSAIVLPERTYLYTRP